MPDDRTEPLSSRFRQAWRENVNPWGLALWLAVMAILIATALL